MKIRIVGVSATAITMLVLLLVLFCLSEMALADEGGAQEHKSSISLFSFIKPLGICALGSVLVTFGTGLFRRKLGKRFLKIHRTFAWLTVGLALCHGILVLSFF